MGDEGSDEEREVGYTVALSSLHFACSGLLGTNYSDCVQDSRSCCHHHLHDAV